MASASERVFGITELLECVLLEGLSAAEVTRARRINSFCRNSIDNSTPLRRVMFLEPILERDHDFYQMGSEKSPYIPTICSMHPAIHTHRTRTFNRHHFAFQPPPPHWYPGQWRDMLITQPPSIQYHIFYQRSDKWYASLLIEGETLGALCEALKTLAMIPGATADAITCRESVIDQRTAYYWRKCDMEERQKVAASKARKLAYNRDKRARCTIPCEDWSLAIVHEKQARRKDRKEFEGFAAADGTKWGFVDLFDE